MQCFGDFFYFLTVCTLDLQPHVSQIQKGIQKYLLQNVPEQVAWHVTSNLQVWPNVQDAAELHLHQTKGGGGGVEWQSRDDYTQISLDHKNSTFHLGIYNMRSNFSVIWVLKKTLSQTTYINILKGMRQIEMKVNTFCKPFLYVFGIIAPLCCQ